MADIPLHLDVADSSSISPFPLSGDTDSNSNSSNSNSTNTSSSNTSGNGNSIGGSTSSNITGKNTVIMGNRKRSNSQSQVVANATPTPVNVNVNGSSATTTYILPPGHRQHTLQPKKRNPVQYYVTLIPLNDTFIKKHLPVSTFPETTKLGRPTGTKHKPDVTNGYFESRVLSRNHAQIFIDPSNGKLMLQDLHSSNGTYVNDVKLGDEPVEINVGDIVCLGFNVQTESTHKQISLKIENISVIPNASPSNSSSDSSFNFSLLKEDSSIEFKHLSFIEDIYRQIKAQESQPNSTTKAQKNIEEVTFDNALFGDINPTFEDNLLGLYSSANSGIFNNSQITNSNTFESIINLLVINLSKIKQQNNNLNSISQFLTNYQENVNSINSKYLDKQFKLKTATITSDLKAERATNAKLYEEIVSLEKQSSKLEETLNQMLKSSVQERDELTSKYDILKDKYDALQVQLETERKSNKVSRSSSRRDFSEFKDASTELILEEFPTTDHTSSNSELLSPSDISNGNGNSVDSHFHPEEISLHRNGDDSNGGSNALMTPTTPHHNQDNDNEINEIIHNSAANIVPDGNNQFPQIRRRNDNVELTPPISDDEDIVHHDIITPEELEELEEIGNDSELNGISEEERHSSISTIKAIFHTEESEAPEASEVPDNSDSPVTTQLHRSIDPQYTVPITIACISVLVLAYWLKSLDMNAVS
ncbi:uncharacterized protein RJT21DRAFT_42023 [Scheffersomyces amazonensis]|uniref:uncharacterized protein n=1 Tax=Scheffersomyces amazonensis TaxID=1078765 RepID=UPI00315C7347